MHGYRASPWQKMKSRSDEKWGEFMALPTHEISPEERAKRQKRNRRRKLDRQKAAEGRALPPVVGLGRLQYLAMFGADADYDAYADAFIAGAKKARRRWEFPLEPLAGASFPSLKRHRKGMPIEGG